MTHLRNFTSKFSYLSLLVLFVLAFQNCSKPQFEATNPDFKLNGNGDSYAGKPGNFIFQDPKKPCSKLSSEGNPFPNRQILIANGEYTLVRDNCQDIQPIVLAASDIVISPDGNTVTYQGQSFDLRADLTEFNLIADLCPAGQTVIPNSMPLNTVSSPLNLTSSDWFKHQGIGVAAYGTIEALPTFQIHRTDPNRLSFWNRLSQFRTLTAGRKYAYTVLLKPGIVNEAMISHYQSDTVQFSIAVNIDTGATSVHHKLGINSLETKTQVYGSGLALTIFFDQQSTGSTDIGFSSYRSTGNQLLGDYIHATAASLKAVDTYCSL